MVTTTFPVELDQVPKQAEHWDDEDVTEWKWHQTFPDHLSIILVIERYPAKDLVEFWPPAGSSEDSPDHALGHASHVVGRHLTEVKGLGQRLQDLVKQALVPVVEAREDHFGLRPLGTTDGNIDAPPVRPFLLGPDDLILAGSWQRNDKATLWVVPADLPDLLPWVIAALREWHHVNPERFPVLPDWHDAAQWRSAEEVLLWSELDEFEGALKAEVDRLLGERKQRLDAIEQAKVRANAFERALLTAQDTPLADAVAEGLRALGFDVRDMDAEAEPGKFKEDYRITDPADGEWIALGEAKGFTKGVSEVGMQSLARWAGFYVQETGTFPSARWYIANHMLRQDPATRPEPLHGRDDVVEVFAADHGLVIDTRALFALVRYAQDNPDRREALRAWLRTQTGVLRIADAQAWISDQHHSPA
jgi:hypothetical protein